MAQPRTDFTLAIKQICAERGIEEDVVFDSIEHAMLAALRRDYDIPDEELEDYTAEIDKETGEVKILKDGEDATPAGFGRIAAQVAKQVIMQRVREAEKDAIIDEYAEKTGTMMTGMVLRFDGPNVVIDIGRGQGLMPPEEQIANEYYRLNQRIAIFIKEIRETYKGKAIIVSRSTPQLVSELFKREVPEVSSGSVEIVKIAREAGHRTKLAVRSTEDGVDPVGSCVGQKGDRVQAVINELNGEKIDIIQYDEDPAEFIAQALAPAEQTDIELDEEKKKATVTVPEDQLSLAIGKGGQNARLAAKLTDYKIDIQGEEGEEAVSASGEEEFEIDELGLSTYIRNTLLDAGIETIEEVEEELDNLTELFQPKSKLEKQEEKEEEKEEEKPEITEEEIEARIEKSVKEVEKAISRLKRQRKQQKKEKEKLEKRKEYLAQQEEEKEA